MIGNDFGEHWCATSVWSVGTSGSPVTCPALSTHVSSGSTLLRNNALVPTMAKSSWHALITALRASSALSFESMKSTSTLRPASLPLVPLMYLPKACTPSTIG